jgi:hypothetical protein
MFIFMLNFCYIPCMMRIPEKIRLKNLELLIAEAGSAAKLADRVGMRIHEDQVSIMELGFHADAAYAQDIRIIAATDRAGQQLLTVLGLVTFGDFHPFASLYPGDHWA